MKNKKQPAKPKETPKPVKHPPPEAEETPLLPLSKEEELDIIPEEDLFETPPYEPPQPGEGP
jgi:hypothetical protein